MKSLQLSQPHLIVTIGIPGAGKSEFSSKFAQTFNAPCIDYAELRQMAGDDKLAAQIANYALSQLLLTRQTIVIDGRGDKLADRRELVSLAQKHGYKPLFVWVQTAPATAEQRSVHAKTATMTLEEFDAKVDEFQNPSSAESVLVISGKHTYASQARAVLKRLAAERPTVEKTKIKLPPPRPLPTRGRITR